jgi:hypothetical protein
VEHVSDDGHGLPLQRPPALVEGVGVEQGLGGMGMGAVARVHHRAAHLPGDEVRGSGGRVAEDDDVRSERLDVPHRVHQRLALGHARGRGVEVQHVRPERLGRALEGQPGAGAVLEEEVGDHAAAERPQRRARPEPPGMEPGATEEQLDVVPGHSLGG